METSSPCFVQVAAIGGSDSAAREFVAALRASQSACGDMVCVVYEIVLLTSANEPPAVEHRWLVEVTDGAACEALFTARGLAVGSWTVTSVDRVERKAALARMTEEQRALRAAEEHLVIICDNLARLPSSKRLAEVLDLLGGVLTDQGKFVGAEARFHRSIAVKQELIANQVADEYDIATTAFHLGVLYSECGQWKRAVASLKSGLEIFATFHSEFDVARVKELLDRAEAEERKERNMRDCVCQNVPGRLVDFVGDRQKSIVFIVNASLRPVGQGLVVGVTNEMHILTALHVINASEPDAGAPCLGEPLWVKFASGETSEITAIIKHGVGADDSVQPDWAVVACSPVVGDISPWPLSDGEGQLFECCGEHCRKVAVWPADSDPVWLRLGKDGDGGHAADCIGSRTLDWGQSGSPVVNYLGQLVGIYRGSSGVWLFGRSGTTRSDFVSVCDNDKKLRTRYRKK